MKQNIKKIIGFAIFALFFLFIITYAFFRSKDLIFGVKIKNVNIADGLPAVGSAEGDHGAKVENNIIKVAGNAKNAVNLTLNGREVSTDQEGNFDETMALLSGYNVVEIKAQDKFGHGDEKNYKLIY